MADTGGGGVNIDTSGIVSSLNKVAEALTPANKTIIRDCAIRLFSNTNFDNNSKSPIQIAKDCVSRALILAKEMQSQGLLE